MIFTVINIDTGYLNRPNWLLAGYSVYHRVASRASQPGSQPTMFMTGPRTRHQRATRRCVRDAQCLWQARDLGTSSGACMRRGTPGRDRRTGKQSDRVYPRCAILQQGMHMKVFSEVYCNRVYFLCAERFETGSGFDPHQRHPPTQLKFESPPPPPPGGGGQLLENVNVINVLTYCLTTTVIIIYY